MDFKRGSFTFRLMPGERIQSPNLDPSVFIQTLKSSAGPWVQLHVLLAPRSNKEPASLIMPLFNTTPDPTLPLSSPSSCPLLPLGGKEKEKKNQELAARILDKKKKTEKRREKERACLLERISFLWALKCSDFKPSVLIKKLCVCHCDIFIHTPQDFKAFRRFPWWI